MTVEVISWVPVETRLEAGAIFNCSIVAASGVFEAAVLTAAFIFQHGVEPPARFFRDRRAAGAYANSARGGGTPIGGQGALLRELNPLRMSEVRSGWGNGGG